MPPDCLICGKPIVHEFSQHPGAHRREEDAPKDICDSSVCCQYGMGILEAITKLVGTCNTLHSIQTGSGGEAWPEERLRLYRLIKYKIDNWKDLKDDNPWKPYEDALVNLCKAVMAEYENDKCYGSLNRDIDIIVIKTMKEALE